MSEGMAIFFCLARSLLAVFPLKLIEEATANHHLEMFQESIASVLEVGYDLETVEAD